MNPLMNGMNIGGMSGARAGAGMGPDVMQVIQSCKRAMGMLRAAKNPQAALQAAAQQDPMLGGVMQMLGGRDPQSVFYAECKRYGADPEQVLSLLR